MNFGSTGSATYLQTLGGLGDMMNVLPDNTGNQITPRNVRDVVLMLYDDLTGLSASLTNLIYNDMATNVHYSNPNAYYSSLGGIRSWINF
jgi:hypothetical protein